MKKLIATIAFLISIAFIVGVSQEDAQANVSDSSHPIAYIIARGFYTTVSNDEYVRVIQKVGDRRAGTVGDVLQHAAVDVCEETRGGTLYEDYSCSK